MKLLATSILWGCNVYHDKTVIRQEVDLGEFAGVRSAEAGRYFTRRFIKRFQSLGKPPSEETMLDAFLDRLGSAEGALLVEVLFHAILAVETSMAYAMRRFNVIKFAEIIPTPERALLVWNCCSPSVSRRAAEVGFIGLVELLPRGLQRAFGAAEETSFDIAYGSLWRYARRRRLPYNGSNVVQTLERKGIPWERMPFNRTVIRAGQGRFQQYLGDAQTETTSRLGCVLARNKHITNRLLKDLRIPVPLQAKPDTIEEALTAAENIGYPVVVKPLNGSKGQVVSAGLKSPDEIPSAFERASRFGSGVVVESFVEGQDHRLLVIGGQFIAATQRVAPFVTGDGKRTIEKLIAKLNSDPRRDGITLVKITQDEELDRLLDRSGYTLDTVLGKGEKFALRSMANQSTGGTTTDVTDRVHSDNQEMAIRAAEVLGLNIAGIDFITTDISISCKQAGAIIEVNNAPGLDLHTWPAEGEPRNVSDVIVGSLFPASSQGRVPVALVADARWNSPVALVLDDILRSAGMTVGLVIGREAFVDGEPTGAEDASHRQAIRSVLRNRRVETLVSTVSLQRVLRRGLVHDTCEVAAIIETPNDIDMVEARQALEVVLRSTRGKLVVGIESEPALEAVEGIPPGRLVLVSPNAGDTAARRRLEAYLEAGGRAVVTARDRDDRFILLLDGDRTVARIPVNGIAALSGKLSNRRLEAHLFAVALAHGMSVSGEAITAALCDGMPFRETSSPGEAPRPAMVASVSQKKP